MSDSSSQHTSRILDILGFDQPRLVGEDDSLRPVAQIKLHKNATDVGLHGLLGDKHVLRDLSVGQSVCDEGENLGLTYGQFLDTFDCRALGPPNRAKSAISRRVTDGAMIASPLATVRTASASSPADASLRRNPAAPARRDS